MDTNAITKLASATGNQVWTRGTNYPAWDWDDVYQPVRLFVDGDALYAVIPDDNSTTQRIIIASINKLTGSLVWAESLSDHNAAFRDNYGILNTHWSQTYGDITTNSDHIFVTLPRYINGEGDPDSAHILGIAKDAFHSYTGSKFDIALSDPDWMDVTENTAFFNVEPDLIDVELNITTENANSLRSAPRTADYMYTLPPVQVDVRSSLEVTNIAKVGQLIISEPAPQLTGQLGSYGDLKGMIRWNDQGMWVCNRDYTDDGSNIWSLSPFVPLNGGQFKSGSVGFSTNYGRVGCPGDVAGDIRLVGNKIYYCDDTYNGTTEIWFPTTPVDIGNGISTAYSENWTNTTDPAYPTGRILTDSTFSISVVSGGGAPYDIAGGCIGKPAANAVILQFRAVRQITVTLQDGNGWIAGTAASNYSAFRITINGMQYSSVSFQPGGTVPYSWSNMSYTMYAGDTLRVIAPSTQDPTLANVSFTIKGNT